METHTRGPETGLSLRMAVPEVGHVCQSTDLPNGGGADGHLLSCRGQLDPLSAATRPRPASPDAREVNAACVCPGIGGSLSAKAAKVGR